MRNLTLISLLLILVIACQNTDKKEKETNDMEALSTVSYEIDIDGMTCTGCEETIKAGINRLEGVKMVEAHHTHGHAIVEFIEGKTDTTAIKEAITGSGYLVKGIKKVVEDTPIQ